MSADPSLIRTEDGDDGVQFGTEERSVLRMGRAKGDAPRIFPAGIDPSLYTLEQLAAMRRARVLASAHSFAAAIGAPLPSHTYLHAQRWGSAFPAPLTHGRDADGRSDATKEVLGTAFDASPTEKFAGLGGAVL